MHALTEVVVQLCVGAQMVGVAVRVSCATPVIGPALGLLGVGLASAAAGQASRRTLRWYQGTGPHPLAWPPWEGVRREDVALDAVAGLVVWRVSNSPTPLNVILHEAYYSSFQLKLKKQLVLVECAMARRGKHLSS